MKNTLIPLVILLLFVNWQIAKQSEKMEYLEIKHVGIEEKPIEPLFIGVKEVNIEVKGGYAIINNQKSQLLTGRDKMFLSNSYYSVLIVDNLTFQKICHFIYKYPLFAKSEDSKTINYSIILKGKMYNISYKQTKVFFANLVRFLKAENCKQESVNPLQSYFNTNFY